jgi:hypothetical protein
MTTNKTTLVFADKFSRKQSCLDLYLNADRKRTKLNLPGDSADIDSDSFEESLEKLQIKISSFLDSKVKQKSVLVLGKIQSGKTAHMLGTLAWAVDSNISFSVIFTGINGDLNEQTQARLKSSLGALGEGFVKVFEVPTSSDGPDYEILKDEVLHLIRLRNQGISPMPVLVTMKNKYRISTVAALAQDVAEEFGSEVVGLYFDDEADQASQNSGSQKRTISVTYESFTKVREKELRNVWLSYTATPQAVLLTEKHGLIRPDQTVVASPRLGYFGLNDAVSDRFENQRIVVEDWPHGKKELSSCPQSLKNSIHYFFFTAMIRFSHPGYFYSLGDFNVNDITSKLKSVQMMIHTSNSTVSHKSTFGLVESEIESWRDELINFQSMRLSGKVNSVTQSELMQIATGIVDRLGRETPFTAEELISEAAISIILDLINEVNLMIVNADSKRPNKHITFPNEQSEWEKSRVWIAIGGDILGRGLTLPQLVTTYFMRTSKVPNFDTVSQQMRFCGYRNSYFPITTIWAPQETFDSFYYMSQIENIVWKRALKWDSQNLDISKNLPAVMYAAPLSSRMEPTRKAVQDPDLVDSKISGELIFSSRRFMNPTYLKKNISLTKKWIARNQAAFEPLNEWLYAENPDVSAIIDLLEKWGARSSETSMLKGVCELFADDMDGLGLAEIPISVFVSRSIDTVDIGSPKNLEIFQKSIKFGRSVSGDSTRLNINTWTKAVLDDDSLGQAFDDLAVTHVGGGQRKLRNHIPYDASVLIIEFMNGYKNIDGKKTQISLGLALSILSPGNYDVRVIGHSE